MRAELTIKTTRKKVVIALPGDLSIAEVADFFAEGSPFLAITQTLLIASSEIAQIRLLPEAESESE